MVSVCMIHDLGTEAACSFRLPFAGPFRLHVWGEHVLLVDCQPRGLSYIWDLQSRSLREFNRDLHEGHIIVNEHSVTSVWWPTLEQWGKRPLKIDRYTLHGQLVSQETIALTFGHETSTALSMQEEFHVPTPAIGRVLDLPEPFSKAFDSVLLALDKCDRDVRAIGINYLVKQRASIIRDYCHQYQLADGVLYVLKPFQTWEVLDLTTSHPRSCVAEIKSILGTTSDAAKPSSHDFQQARALLTMGDENCLVRVAPGSIEVYCFNEDCHLAGEDVAYRVERMRRMTERINARRNL